MGNEDYGKREENHNENRIEGRHGVLEAFRAEQLIERLFVQRGCKDGPVMSILREAKKAGTMVDFVPKERLDQMSETGHHQGVIATISAFRYSEIEDMFALAEKRGEDPFIFLLDGIEDPHNLGAIIRSAYLCGAHGVVIPKRGGVGVTGTVMKSSAGAAARLPVARVSNLAQAIRTIKEHNIFVYCADLGGAPLAKTDLSGPVALVLGSEGGGPSALTRKLCDAAVTLEMAPGQSTGVDSYNVSVAAGILCYDVLRRRTAKK